MCLTIRDSQEKHGRIAAKDIICFKVLTVEEEGTPNAKAVSPYQYHKYNLGELVTAEVKVESGYRDAYWTIDEGLHSFVDFKSVCREAHPDNNNGDYIFVAVIPKGTRYWVGNFNDTNDSYASEALIVLDRKSARSQKYLRNRARRVRR